MTNAHPPRQDVGSPIGGGTVLALLAAVAVLVIGLILWTQAEEDPADRILVISTGSEGGAYHAVGRALQQTLVADGVFGEVRLEPSAGSAENARRLAAGGVHVALVQSDTPPAEDARLITPLYEEVLHIVLAPDSPVVGIRDLAGRNVSLGAVASGTRAVAQRVLDQFEIAVGQDVPLDMEAAAAALFGGQVEAVFVLTASPSPLVDAWCGRGARLLGLGAVDQEGSLTDALHAIDSALQPKILPRGIYGRAPTEPVQTIAVSALLVAHAETPAPWIQDLTRHLYQQRVRLATFEAMHPIFRRLREDYDPGQAALPYHEGAAAYFERAEPPFFVEYAEATSLVVTLLAGGFSLLIGLRQWYARKRKNRIDAYYNEVRAATAEVDPSPAARRQIRAALLEVRQRAFADLIDEKVEADESFTIFQDYLRTELEGLRLEKAP